MLTLSIIEHTPYPKEVYIDRDNILAKNGTRSIGFYSTVCGECGDLIYSYKKTWKHLNLISKSIHSSMYWGVPY